MNKNEKKIASYARLTLLGTWNYVQLGLCLESRDLRGRGKGDEKRNIHELAFFHNLLQWYIRPPDDFIFFYFVIIIKTL